jgi:23S rRNA pseudouridine1911/1915/1917 synthase
MLSVMLISVPKNLADKPLAGVLRQLSGNLSWSDARRLIHTRKVLVNGTLCLDDARKMRPGDTIELLGQSKPPVPREASIRIVCLDTHLVIIDKPAGIVVERRREEQNWPAERKARQPVLDELMPAVLDRHLQTTGSRVFAVHRLDRETSGLMLYARSAQAQQKLIALFAGHEVKRIYQAVALGAIIAPKTIKSWIIRDRGDGLRGSIPASRDNAQYAITHIRPVETIQTIQGTYTLIECRLETGRTHQIRIHLSEAGHMLCGERLYLRQFPDGPARPDSSNAPRHALHCCEIDFTHPITAKHLHFTSSLPKDLERWLDRLRAEDHATSRQHDMNTGR